ncbi:MAG: LiaF-related protein [Bacteroidia bacterium]|nr:LiaF-related protein [Bacteroidia bacterium]
METTNYFCSKRRGMKKIIFGLFVIAAGILLLGFNSGIINPEYEGIVFSWQSLLIALGIINLFDHDSWVPGTILIAVGAFFMMPDLFDFPYDFTRLFWPALLILAGVLMILRRSFGHHFHHYHHHRFDQNCESSLDSGIIMEKNVFGGSRRMIAPCVFKGGKIQNIFGGTEIDLRQTTLAEGKNTLEVKSVFGGVSIYVPADWVVVVEANSVMGGFVDKRMHVPDKTSSSRELIIVAESVFGGGEIKN